MPVARSYLVTDAGFALRFGACLAAALLSALLAAVVLGDGAAAFVDMVSTRFSHKLIALTGSSPLLSWALLGLLSSSCCALKLLLGFFSFGCAGFNTWLGPCRPGFLALTLLAQAWSWLRVATQPSWQPFQWRGAAASSAVCLALSFLPEVLHATLKARARAGAKATAVGAAGTTGSGNGSGVGSAQGDGVRVVYDIEGLGCIACVNTVSRALDAEESVVVSSVDIEAGTVTVVLKEAGAAGGVAELLDGIGFPATLRDGAEGGAGKSGAAKTKGGGTMAAAAKSGPAAEAVVAAAAAGERGGGGSDDGDGKEDGVKGRETKPVRRRSARTRARRAG